VASRFAKTVLMKLPDCVDTNPVKLAFLHCPRAGPGPDPVRVYLNEILFKSKSLWQGFLFLFFKNPCQSDFDLNKISLRYTRTGSGPGPALGQCRHSPLLE